MFSRLKLLYIDDDLLSPDEFPRIVSPASACHELSYIPQSDILSLFDKHGIDQAIKLIEDEKKDNTATIRNRI